MRFANNSHRSFVCKAQAHESLKNSRFNPNSAGARGTYKIFVKFFSLVRIGGAVETGTPPLPAVPQKSELRDHQQTAASLLDIFVHFSRFIWKNPERKRLFHKVIRILPGVSFCDSKQHNKSGFDGPDGARPHLNMRAAGTLKHHDHVSRHSML